MICVQQNPSTLAYEPVTPQPSDLSSCSAVLPSYGELSSPIWNLSASDGAAIGAAILGVWFVAWGGKVLVRALGVRGDD